MGQKVRPTGLRIGITETWRSRWVADKKHFGDFLLEDYKIREFIKKNFAMAEIPRIDIERQGDESIKVIIHTATPGLLIGKGGKRVQSLIEALEKMTNKRVELERVEVQDPSLSAQLVAEGIARQLEKRAPHRRTMHKVAETAMNNGAEGIKIKISGRIAGADIARSEEIIRGKIPLHTLRADIDYGFTEAIIAKGKIGVKVWIYKGEVFPKNAKKWKE